MFRDGPIRASKTSFQVPHRPFAQGLASDACIHQRSARLSLGSAERGCPSQHFVKTEREGFEPSTEVASCNSLAGSRFQPLSHLSRGLATLSAGCPDRPAPAGSVSITPLPARFPLPGWLGLAPSQAKPASREQTAALRQAPSALSPQSGQAVLEAAEDFPGDRAAGFAPAFWADAGIAVVFAAQEGHGGA